jgi:hypothetical protein
MIIIPALKAKVVKLAYGLQPWRLALRASRVLRIANLRILPERESNLIRWVNINFDCARMVKLCTLTCWYASNRYA